MAEPTKGLSVTLFPLVERKRYPERRLTFKSLQIDKYRSKLYTGQISKFSQRRMLNVLRASPVRVFPKVWLNKIPGPGCSKAG